LAIAGCHHYADWLNGHAIDSHFFFFFFDSLLASFSPPHVDCRHCHYHTATLRHTLIASFQLIIAAIAIGY